MTTIEQTTPAVKPSTAKKATDAQEQVIETTRSFEEITSDYWDNKNRGSALAYLKNLSKSEFKVISEEHGFAADLPTNSERFRNLLHTDEPSLDEIGHGSFDIEGARPWHFPNDNTPPDVKEAWNEATQDMSKKEKARLAGTLFSPLPQLHEDPVTGKTTLVEPDSPCYEKKVADRNYRERVNRALEILDNPSNLPANVEFYKLAKRFCSKLIESMNTHGVN